MEDERERERERSGLRRRVIKEKRRKGKRKLTTNEMNDGCLKGVEEEKA